MRTVLTIIVILSLLFTAHLGAQNHICNGHGLKIDRDKKEPLRRIASPFKFDAKGNLKNSIDCSLSATIIVNYTGFTPQAQTAFEYAVNIWERCIRSSRPIYVDARFESLGPTVLGRAIPANNYIGNDLPIQNIAYPVALTNNLLDLDANNNVPEILTQFNSDFDWYYGTDGNTPLDKVDFVTVVLHELCHGLGFASTSTSDGTASGSSIGTEITINGQPTLVPTVYDWHIETGNGVKIISVNNFSPAMRDVLKNDWLFFDGSNANASNGGNPPKMFAPDPYDSGSSISHLDEVFENTANSLMTNDLAMGEFIHDPGALNLAILKDLGWQINTNCYASDLYVDKSFNGFPQSGTFTNPYRLLTTLQSLAPQNAKVTFKSSGSHDEVGNTPLVLNRKYVLRTNNASVVIK